ncbi:MAG: hypothetical protein Q9219_007168 [cf. Caloplaca sp. 3 TL-2023]
MSSSSTSLGGPIYFFREYEQTHGYLSQWFEAPFNAPSTEGSAQPMNFRTTEQYMMYHKAILFKDLETGNQIMLADSPKKQKALGRKVKNFDGHTWNMHREKIVEEGNWNKFCNSKEGSKLKGLLAGTGDRELVEVRKDHICCSTLILASRLHHSIGESAFLCALFVLTHSE